VPSIPFHVERQEPVDWAKPGYGVTPVTNTSTLDVFVELLQLLHILLLSKMLLTHNSLTEADFAYLDYFENTQGLYIQI
jgi:hypothetical protein